MQHWAYRMRWGGGAILGSGAGPCLGDRAEGRGFSSGSQAGEMGFASFAHCITLWVVGSHWWFTSMVSYVTQRKADILQVMGKESPQVLTQSSQWGALWQLSGGLGRYRGLVLEAGTGHGHGPHEKGRCSTHSRAEETKWKRKGSFSVHFRGRGSKTWASQSVGPLGERKGQAGLGGRGQPSGLWLSTTWASWRLGSSQSLWCCSVPGVWWAIASLEELLTPISPCGSESPKWLLNSDCSIWFSVDPPCEVAFPPNSCVKVLNQGTSEYDYLVLGLLKG